jgi:hypothetical protein
VVDLSNFSQWSPDEYLQDYYCDIKPDERETIRFTVQEFRKIQRQPIALEVGVGPTLHRALALSPHVRKIHATDYLSANLQKVDDWVEQRPTAHDWSAFTRYILQCEGIKNPIAEQIANREQQTRERIQQYQLVDATRPEPISNLKPLSKHRMQYAVVVSCYCADSITIDRAIWAAAMQNIVGLLAPGGFFVTAALRNCGYYRVGNRYFPCANINEQDMHQVLLECGIDSTTMVLEVASVPEHRSIGYDSIILASGFVA